MLSKEKASSKSTSKYSKDLKVQNSSSSIDSNLSKNRLKDLDLHQFFKNTKDSQKKDKPAHTPYQSSNIKNQHYKSHDKEGKKRFKLNRINEEEIFLNPNKDILDPIRNSLRSSNLKMNRKSFKKKF